jgi:hypothetical protein
MGMEQNMRRFVEIVNSVQNHIHKVAVHECIMQLQVAVLNCELQQ